MLALEDRLFAEWRIAFYGTGLVIAWVLDLAWLFARGKWLVHNDGLLGSFDSCLLWVAGKFAATSDPSRIYDIPALAAAQNIYFRPTECGFIHHYIYPPTSLFFAYPLGLMPYLTAFAVWTATTFLIYEAAIFLIVRRPAAPIAAAAPVPVLLNALDGYNGFLTAGLMGLSLACLERRPWLAGIFLGLLTYKPQFGILFPLALLASRNWRALAGAAAASLAFGIAASLAFGSRTWPAFIVSVLDLKSGFSAQTGIEPWLESPYGLLRWGGASPEIAWGVHIAAAAVTAALVGYVWARRNPHALRAAVLALGSVIVTPYELKYDLCILSIAVAFLVKDGLARGFLVGERSVILACFALLFLLLTLLPPVTPFVCGALLVLCIRRVAAWRERPSVAAAILVPGEGS